MRNNILLVANYTSDVGYAWWLMGNFWSEISLHFQKANRTCTLLYPKVNSVPDTIKRSPIDIIEHDFSKRGLGSLSKLIGIIRKNNIGYVYLTDRDYNDWLYLLMRMSGVRKIVNHDHMPGERARPSSYKKMVKKIIHSLRIFSCDHYIGVSEFVMNRATDIACVPAEKCSFIHNGIKVFDNTQSTYANDMFNIPIGSKIVVTTGRADFYKGIDTLITCAHILIHEKGIENLYFLHIGGGPDLQIFKQMAAKLRVQDKFIFAGFRPDVANILPSCDIGIQVSLGEAFSLSILEYMCAGLVTLAPNNCGNAEAIEDGVNGLLLTPGSISEIVDKIITILSDEKLSMTLKTEARKRVVEKFTIEACNNKLKSLLEKQFAL